MEVYKEIKRDLFLFCVIVLLLQLLWFALPFARDDTDGSTRSGLEPRIDARTGCQYLEAQSGGITPRLDKNGRQICAP